MLDARLPRLAAVLPVVEVLPELARVLSRGTAAVLVAPPGAGKTTVVPLFLLGEPWCTGRVLVLEPRRLAARAAAARMADLLGERVGGTIGHRMRGDTRVGSGTRIEVVTEGVLTRMLHADASLDGVSAVLFDEFHERSLDADLGLALAREVHTTVRPDLRIVVMSATLAAKPIAALLDEAPVVISEGRLFPVETVHDPAEPGEPWDRAVARVVRRALAEQQGDVLVFCPGVGEIGRVARLLHGIAADVLALHGSLPLADQTRALAAAGRRRVVLSTSVAQTSVTVEGITVVVDGGLARVPRYDARRGMGHLATVRVSRATADQRRGRAGRLQQGTCYRLWSSIEDARLVSADAPEILEADLAPLALDLASWGAPTGEGLCWLDPPPPAALAMARELLVELGACTPDGRLTTHGRALAELGMHPRLGHLVVRGAELGHGPLACRLAALLSERDPWPTRRGSSAGDGSVSIAGRRTDRPVDLSLRLQLLAGRAVDGMRGDAVTIDRIRRDAARLASLVHVSSTHEVPDDDHDLAVLVALAYPDRLAQLRAGSRTRYRLAAGGGVALGDHDPLAGSPWLAVADLDGAVAGTHGDGVVRLAAALDPRAVEPLVADRIAVVDVIGWERGDVVARRERRVGVLVLDSRPLAADDVALLDEITDVLIGAVRAEGLSLLTWTPDASRLRARVGFLHDVIGEPWPDVDDDVLLDSLEAWLRPMLAGARRRADLERVDVTTALRNLVGRSRLGQLDRLAPERLRVPSGRDAVVDYEQRPPVLAVKLQEMFGATATPTLADGRVPVVLHLLSPAGRPVQITQDLAGFWAGAYRAVRSDLRGRYPRHPWPEDPLHAAPTARVKPRGT